MKAQIGFYTSVAVLILMSFFPIIFASCALAEAVGNIIAPKDDHILIFLMCMGCFWLLMTLVFVGLLQRREAASKAAGLIFVGDLAAIGWAHLQAGDFQTRLERGIGLASAGICLGGAIYFWSLTWKLPGLTAEGESEKGDVPTVPGGRQE